MNNTAVFDENTFIKYAWCCSLILLERWYFLYISPSYEIRGVYARLVQLVGSLTTNQKVPGSIPGLVEG